MGPAGTTWRGGGWGGEAPLPFPHLLLDQSSPQLQSRGELDQSCLAHPAPHVAYLPSSSLPALGCGGGHTSNCQIKQIKIQTASEV